MGLRESADKRISIGSAVVAGLTVVTNTQADHATTSVATARIQHCVRDVLLVNTSALSAYTASTTDIA